MNTKLFILALLVSLMSISALAEFIFTQTFSGQVTGANEDELIVVKVYGRNFLTNTNNNRYDIQVQGPENALVEFYARNKRIKVAQITGLSQTTDLDVTIPEVPATIEPIPEEFAEPVEITPDIIPAYYWPLIILCALLILAGGVIYSITKPAKEPEVKEAPEKQPIEEEHEEAEQQNEETYEERHVEELPKEPTPPEEHEEKLRAKKSKEFKGIILPLTIAEQKAIDYITEMKEKGFEDKQIKATLFASGWRNEDIEHAFKLIKERKL